MNNENQYQTQNEIFQNIMYCTTEYLTKLHLSTYHSHEVRSICHLMYRIIVQFGFLNKTGEHISFYGILENN